MLQYLDLNSAYRDRKVWPKASEFAVPFSRAQTTSASTALDPVSLSAPILAWSGNALAVDGAAVIGDSLPSVIIVSPSGVSNCSDTQTMVISMLSATFQEKDNYYNGLTIELIDNSGIPTINIFRRITASHYAGTYVSGLSSYSRTEISLDISAGVYVTGLQATIRDPSDFTDTSFPVLFVPCSADFIEDAYVSYIVYNESINEYRPVLSYNSTTHCVVLDTTGATSASTGPVAGWAVDHNFSIRKQQPLAPPLGQVYPFAVSSVAGGSVVVSDASNLLSAADDAYKGMFLRVMPYQASAPNYIYNFTPAPTIDETRRIVGYSYAGSSATFLLDSPFTTAPATDSPIEVLPFSYDNVVPMSFSGSLVSQQERVCYELNLLSLIVPNKILRGVVGGFPSAYPYFYVEIANESMKGPLTYLYSNNPNCNRALFRSSVYDTNNISNTPFTHLSSDGKTSVVKFKTTDSMYVRVFFANGQSITSFGADTASPAAPDPYAQFSLLFSIKRL